MSPIRSIALVLFAGCALAACSRAPSGAAATAAAPDEPPHGGTAVALGDGLYRVEFVRDPSAGRIDAYILDDEMETFIRVADPSFDVVATVGGEKRPLHFLPVANAATGEAVGSTSLFSAQADWLKTTAEFDAVIEHLDIRTHHYAGVAFAFPQGKD